MDFFPFATTIFPHFWHTSVASFGHALTRVGWMWQCGYDSDIKWNAV